MSALSAFKKVELEILPKIVYELDRIELTRIVLLRSVKQFSCDVYVENRVLSENTDTRFSK